MKLTDLKQVKKTLTARWEKGRFLKAEADGEALFPYEFLLAAPSAAQISEQYDEIRDWVSKIKSGCEKAGIEIEWREVNHRQLGRNSIPRKIIFNNVHQLTDFIGKNTELNVFEDSIKVLQNVFPELTIWAGAHPFDLIACARNLDRLLSVVLWIKNNPKPQIYLRQLSLPGVDTKFIEKNRKLLSSWLDIILGPLSINEHYSGVSKFEQRYGFSPRPGLIRFRLLDPLLNVDGFSDLNVLAAEFASWKPEVKRVFIIENDITALAFPNVADSMLIFGRGYNFTDLAFVKWLNEKELWYWGDIDTHGFAILNQFRESFPQTRSFLMDRATLMKHQAHWGEEKKQASALELQNLTKEETLLYLDLKNDNIKTGLRLEQEFIDFSLIDRFIQELQV